MAITVGIQQRMTFPRNGSSTNKLNKQTLDDGLNKEAARPGRDGTDMEIQPPQTKPDCRLPGNLGSSYFP